jgi:CxxC motif-containing protein (DUF1111 family)
MRLATITVVALAACGDNAHPTDLPDATLASVRASDVPIDGLTAADVARFNDGDALFDLPFLPADGLGPLYVRNACGSCHDGGARGPGLVQKMSVVLADGITAAADQSELPYGHSIRQGLAAGATTPVVPPDDPDVKVSIRVGPPVLGRGYLEAIADGELMRVEAEQAARTDAIHGAIDMTTFISVPNPDASFGTFTTGEVVIGRFGLKARIVTLDEFTADAFQGDMGMTTPMRPTELPNPDGLTDDLRPGVDLDIEHVDKIAFYLRRIAIPKRIGMTDAGAALFAQIQCAACHAPTMHTRADYPIAQLADIDAPVYTDMLLHDMGPALADGMTDASSKSPQWRTAPLIGLRFSKAYLHDARAHSITEAIQAHAGEGTASAAAFAALSADDQATLLAFIEAL